MKQGEFPSAIDDVIIIEVNGQRVRSEVIWPKRSRVLVIAFALLDAAGEPLPFVEGEPPVEMMGTVTMQPDQEYSEHQALHDVEIARHRFATELAGHSHVPRCASASAREKLKARSAAGGDSAARPAARKSEEIALPICRFRKWARPGRLPIYKLFDNQRVTGGEWCRRRARRFYLVRRGRRPRAVNNLRPLARLRLQ
jgi:hypothetical protein